MIMCQTFLKTCASVKEQTNTHTHTNKGTKRDLCYMISHSNIGKSLRRRCYLKNKSKKKRNICEIFMFKGGK